MNDERTWDLAVATDSGVSLWGSRTGDTVGKLLPGSDVVDFAFSPARRWLACLVDSDLVQVCDLDSGVLVQELSRDDDLLTGIAFHPTGSQLAMSGFLGVRIWDASNGRVLRDLPCDGARWGVTFSPDGRKVVAVGRGVHFWDLSTGELRHVAHVDHDWTELEYSPDARTLVASGAGALLLDAGTGAARHVLAEPNVDVQSVAFNASGSCVVGVCTDGKVRLWDARTGALQRIIDHAEHSPRVARFSPEGDLLAVGSDGGTVYLWDPDADRGRVLQIGGEVSALAFRPSSRRLLDAVVSRLREAHCQNPSHGLLRWFEVFDEHAHRGDAEVCEALIAEARDQDYPFGDDGERYLRSREGVLRFLRGVEHHRAGRHELAREAYSESIAIQREVRCTAAEGQVTVFCDFLEAAGPDFSVDGDPALQLGEIHVLGSGEAFLEKRLSSVAPHEKQGVVEAALRAHATTCLAAGLHDPSGAVRRMSAAGLAHFTDPDGLDAMWSTLCDPQWFVRWRAADFIGQLGSRDALLVFSLSRALTAEMDPEVCRALARALGGTGSSFATRVLVSALSDDDVDVRFAALEALEKVGNRRALPALKKPFPGTDILGRPLEELRVRVERAIQERCPLPSVTGFSVGRRRADGTIEPGEVFWAGEDVFSFIELSTVPPGVKIRISTRDGRGEVHHREALFEDLLPRVGGAGASGPRSRRLVELLDEPPPAGGLGTRRSAPREGVFGPLPATALPGAAAGSWRVEVSVLDPDLGEYEVQRRGRFDLVRDVEVTDVRVQSPVAIGQMGAPPTLVVLSIFPVVCCVTLSAAPKGTAVIASDASPPRSNSFWQQARTERDGPQTVEIPWFPSRSRGTCVLDIIVAGKLRKKLVVTVVDQVKIERAAVSDGRGAPGLTGKRFGTDQESVHCSVWLSVAPAATAVLAVWEYRGRSGAQAPVAIATAVAITERSGPQTLSFDLSRPECGWPVGSYAVRLAVLAPHETMSLCDAMDPLSRAGTLEAQRWTTVEFAVDTSPPDGASGARTPSVPPTQERSPRQAASPAA